MTLFGLRKKIIIKNKFRRGGLEVAGGLGHPTGPGVSPNKLPTYCNNSNPISPISFFLSL
jgi:hypothetical protein